MAAVALVLVNGYLGVKACGLAKSALERLTVSPEASYERLRKKITSETEGSLPVNSNNEAAFIHNHRVLSVALRFFMLLGAIFALGAAGSIIGPLSQGILSGAAFFDQWVFAARITIIGLASSMAADRYYRSSAQISNWR